jgi:CHAT domain-containing protein/Tfp pilus assembly protein PilF
LKVLSVILFSTIITISCAQDSIPAWKLNYDSTQLFWNKDWNRTLALLKRAEAIALTDVGLYDENYLSIVNDIGLVYWKLQDFKNSEKFLSKALELKKEYFATDDNQLFIAACNLAGLYAEDGNFEKSKTIYVNFVRPRMSSVSEEVFESTLPNLLPLYVMHHSPDTAAQLIKNVKKKIGQTATALPQLKIEFFNSKLYRKNKEFEKARVLLDSIILKVRIDPTIASRLLYVESLYELGSLYTETGFFSRAEQNLLDAVQELNVNLNAPIHLQIQIMNTLAFVYEQLSIYTNAIDYYERALKLCSLIKANSAQECLTLRNNIAAIHLKAGNLEKAIESYSTLVNSFNGEGSETNELYLTGLNNLATAYRKSNEQKRAADILENVLSSMHHHRVPENDLMATLMNNLGIIHTEQGDYHEAAEQFKKALAIKSSIYGENSIQLLDIVNNLAIVEWALNRHEQAVPLFKKAMELSTRHVKYVFPNLNESEQVQFYKKLKEDFERFNTMAIQLAHVDPSLVRQMFDNQLIIKSIVFFTNHRRSLLLASDAESTLGREIGDVKVKRDELGKLYQNSNQNTTTHEAISQLENEIDVLEKSIGMKTSATSSGYEVTWSLLQNKINEDEAIVDIIRFRKYDLQKIQNRHHKVFGFTDSVYYAALITTSATIGKPELVLFHDGVNFESRFLNYYKNALNFGVEDNVTYNFYWAPIARHLEGKSKIFLSSDGVYHKINLNTLRDPASGQYVLQKHNLVHVLNPAQILNATTQKQMSRKAVLIGDPVFDVDLDYPANHRNADDMQFGSLPGTMKEVVAIDKILKQNSWNTEMLLKSEASESNLKKVNHPQILHIASHGFFSDGIVKLSELTKKEFLFHSGLVLAGANKSRQKENRDFNNDGIVTAYDVMNLDLTNTELVVLSACETGLGVVENGEGVHGLQRSFLQAGAKQVLISLWKVDDEITKDLMIRFYENIASGQATREALKNAQLYLIKNNHSPFFWGGFVMVGSE